MSASGLELHLEGGEGLALHRHHVLLPSTMMFCGSCVSWTTAHCHRIEGEIRVTWRSRSHCRLPASGASRTGRLPSFLRWPRSLLTS